MAIALVRAASVYDGSTRAITMSVTSGDFLLFFYQYHGSNNCSVPTDTQSNTWTLVAERSTAAGTPAYLHAYWTRATATGSITVTGATATSADDYGESLHEYSGCDTGANVIDITNTAIGASGSDAGPAQVTLTGVAANALIAAIAGDESGGATYTALTDYTRETWESTHTHATLDRIITTGGNYTPGFSLSAGRGWVIVAGSVKAAASSGAITATLAAAASVTADLKGSGALAANLYGQTYVSAPIAGFSAIQATTTATAALTATLAGSGTLAAAPAATGSLTAVMTGAGDLAAILPATTTVTADLTAAGAGAMTATLYGQTYVSALLTGTGDLVATLTVLAALTGTLTPPAPTAGGTGGYPPVRARHVAPQLVPPRAQAIEDEEILAILS